MDRGEILVKIRDILGEILDISPDEIYPSSYMIRDLKVESIDLLEMAVALNSVFGIDVDEDMAFLKQLRLVVERAKEEERDRGVALREAFPHLGPERIEEILSEMEDGPVLKVGDVVAYVEWELEKS